MTRTVTVKNLPVGGGNPVSIQSMTNTPTGDAEATAAQIQRLAAAGCQIVRVAVLNAGDAAAISEIKDRVTLPLVADIHFDWRLAIAAVEHGADKIRFNPGNIGEAANVRRLADAAKAHGVPIRVGVNAGSLEKEILAKYGNTPKALAESALRQVRLLEKCGFHDIVVSVKASDVAKTVKANLILSRQTDCPLHLGVTEAGTYEQALVKSAAGVGGLLAQGIGDTIRVSITGDPVREVAAAQAILRAVGLRRDFVEVVSCPTCGRCQIALEPAVARVIEHTREIGKPLKVAVMGCAVNGIGEGRDADVGLAGGKGEAVLFSRGEILRKVPEERMVEELLEEIDRILGEEV